MNTNGKLYHSPSHITAKSGYFFLSMSLSGHFVYLVRQLGLEARQDVGVMDRTAWGGAGSAITA